MPVPGKHQPPPPSRSVDAFTLGTGRFRPPTSSSATQPNLAQLQTTAPSIHVLGSDQQQRSVSVPALAAGQSYTITLVIPLPGIPGAAAGVTARSNDKLTFIASVQSRDSVAGTSISHITAIGRALSGTQTFTGPVLPGGQTYRAFSVLATVVMLANQTTAAGVQTLVANGVLQLQSQGNS